MQLHVVIILILCTALYNGPGFTLSYVVWLAHKYICTLLKKSQYVKVFTLCSKYKTFLSISSLLTWVVS